MRGEDYWLERRKWGRIKLLCDCICIPSGETARIQECHILVGHILCGLVEKGYFQPEG